MSRKIYNEVIIDMNPESSTFEDVIHEDSFEYEGDLALSQGSQDTAYVGSGWTKQEFKRQDDGSWIPTGAILTGQEEAGAQIFENLEAFEEYKTTIQETGNRLFDVNFGEAGLTYEDVAGKNPSDIFKILQDKGVIPSDEQESDWLDDIMNMPLPEGTSQKALDEHAAGVAEDVYGFETDITEAGEDYATIEARAGEDIGLAGEGARSDIYGLQTQGAQQKRAGMFGKGLGGGMSQLSQQDASQSMRGAGQGIMSGLASNVRGLERGVSDAGRTRDRDISEATIGLYGVGGSKEAYEASLIEGAEPYEAEGGVYGTGGTKASIYKLEDAADDKWEGDMSLWIQANI